MRITDKMVLSAFKTSAIFALANMGSSFIDGLVTSHYLGSAAMAAVGLASPFFTISSILCTCVGTGMIALCAHNLGSSNKAMLNKYFNNAIWTMLAVSGVLMAVFLFCTEPIAAVLGARGDDALLKNVSAYIRGLAVGLPAWLLSGVASQSIQMDGGGRTVRISAVCCLVTDTVFDILAAVCEWGLFGIGLATSVSALVKCSVLFTHFFGRNTGALRVQLTKPDFSCIFGMIRSGSDTLTLSVINIVKPVIRNILIISIGGSTALSVLSVYNNFSGFFSVICTGLCSALSITAGMLYGEANKHDLLHTVGFIQKLILILYAPVILLLVIFSGQIARYYLPDAPDMWAMMKFALFCLSFCLIAQSMTSIRIRYLQTINQVRNAHILTFLANFVVVLLCSYLAPLVFGAYGIIVAEAISAVVCILLTVFAVQLRNRKVWITYADYLNLHEKFNFTREAYTDISLKNSDSTDDVTTCLTNFCRENAGASKSVLALPICAEKMLGLRIAAENAKDARYNLNISAQICDDTCRLIIRDDGTDPDISEESFADVLAGFAIAPYSVNMHRVLDYNSMILEMKA